MGAGKRQPQNSSLLIETNCVSERHKGLNRASAAVISEPCACSLALSLNAPLMSLTEAVTRAVHRLHLPSSLKYNRPTLCSEQETVKWNNNSNGFTQHNLASHQRMQVFPHEHKSKQNTEIQQK